MVWSEVPGMGDAQQLQTTHPTEKIRENCSLTCSLAHKHTHTHTHPQINTVAHSKDDDKMFMHTHTSTVLLV